MKVVRVGGRGFDCNIFLLKDDKANRYALIDAGIGNDHARIMQEVAAVIEPQRIETVAITHEHLDHVNGLPHWRSLGATIATSGPCAHKLQAGHDPTSAAFGMDIPSLTVDRIIEDEEDIELAGTPFRALATPGHSPGSMCYWDASSATLFSGDVLFAQGGIGRFDFPDSDLQAHAQSILRLEKLPARALHCGHGPSVEGDDVARSIKGSVAHVQSCL